MSRELRAIGIIGGTGALGSAIARAILDRGPVEAGNLWISSRSGRAPAALEGAGLRTTSDNRTLVDRCDLVLLCVPPASAAEIGIEARDRLVVSVMAGVTIERIRALTGAARVARAMSSPAAGRGLAYSPWVAGPGVDEDDRRHVAALLSACGRMDELTDEAQLDLFTAMTGPVPGFVAFFAQCMADYATARGVAPDIADRAVRQLFLAAGETMAEGAARPAEHVREMIDYAGTTAAGLEAMRASPIAEAVAEGLDAAVARARSIA